MTTASAPSSSHAGLGEQLMTPGGVHGRRPGGRARAARRDRRQAVDVLVGVDQAGQLDAVEVAGTGSWQRMPLTVGVGVQRARSARRPPRAAASAGRRWSKPWMPTSAQAFCLPRDVDRAEPASSPTRTVARPGARPVSAVNAATSCGDLRAHAARRPPCRR